MAACSTSCGAFSACGAINSDFIILVTSVTSNRVLQVSVTGGNFKTEYVAVTLGAMILFDLLDLVIKSAFFSLSMM